MMLNGRSKSDTKEDEKKQISNVGLGLDHALMAFPDTLVLLYSYIFPCLDSSRRKDSSEDPIIYDGSSSGSGHWPGSPEPSLGRFYGSPLSSPASPLRSPMSALRSPPSPFRIILSPQPSRKEQLNLSLSQIVKLTHNFSKENVIGEGGFGVVYKAELPDGKFVAIKRGKREQFASLKKEFSNEISLLAQIEHKNLVQLLGYVETSTERIIIAEYVPNGSLRDHLDGQRGTILTFSQRLEIAIDIAHGLTFLHNYAEKPIIHRDVKSTNILLTERLRAKVADFGFARTGPTQDGQTHVSTNIKGTAGYVDPDYLRTYHLSPRSDVFSFGILLMEILSGRRPVEMNRSKEEKITIRWAFAKLNEGRLSEILDPQMKEHVPRQVLKRILALAFQCAAPYRRDRPNMREVCEQLWKVRKDYNTVKQSLSH
ncbi:hypothetical protein LUZ60_000883 [Juncus effusus]|nr:hypothetical protein LUZ60_000883 [Juncus effusus]